jgi:hypothetical protein
MTLFWAGFLMILCMTFWPALFVLFLLIKTYGRHG